MKLYKHEDFLELPEGVVYASLDGLAIGELCIKGKTIYGSENEPIDFFFIALMNVDSYSTHDLVYKINAGRIGAPVPYSAEVGERDGLFDWDMEYLVFTKEDLSDLVLNLQKVQENYPEL